MIGANTQPAQADSNSVYTVRFYMRSEQDNFQSEKQGRPIFFEEPYIEIMCPGRQDLTIDTPVRAKHKLNFPRQWQVFENSQRTADQMQLTGTPLEQWPQVTRQQAEELKGRRFYTVEQIANCTEQQAQALGMAGSMLRQKAKIFLEAAQNTSLATTQAAEIEKLRAERAAKDKKHDEEMADLRAMIAAGSQKKKPGRPKKNVEAAA